MMFKFEKNYVGFSQILIVLIYYLSSVQSFENTGKNHDSTLRKSLLHPYLVGEQCETKICSPNEFCNEEKVCQCSPGYKNYAGHCLQCSGESEICTVKLNCCSMLICFGGVCRKGFEPIEFFTIFKICLGITIVSIIVVIIALLLKGLLNVKCTRWFRQSETNNSNSQQPYVPQCRNPRSLLQETIEEKPPSYEECVKSRSIIDLPPPYIISSNLASDLNKNNTTNTTSVNSCDTSINI